jgi:hypothetical protein
MLVYILFNKLNDVYGVFGIESEAVAHAKKYNLKDWYILTREYI